MNLDPGMPLLPPSVGEVVPEEDVGVPEDATMPPLKLLAPGPTCTAEGASTDVLRELAEEEGEGPAGELEVGVEGPEDGGKGKLLFAAAFDAVVLAICASLGEAAGGTGTLPFFGKAGGVAPVELAEETVTGPLFGTGGGDIALAVLGDDEGDAFKWAEGVEEKDEALLDEALLEVGEGPKPVGGAWL